MRKIEYVYKVVKKLPQSNKMFSKTVVGNKYCLEYKLNEITTSDPNTLGIFCFKTIADAKSYYSYSLNVGKALILKCIPLEILFKNKNSKILISIHCTSNEDLNEFYNYELLESPNKKPQIEGTILCKSIKPIEIVGSFK